MFCPLICYFRPNIYYFDLYSDTLFYNVFYLFFLVSATRKGFKNQIKNLWWRKGKEDGADSLNGPTYAILFIYLFISYDRIYMYAIYHSISCIFLFSEIDYECYILFEHPISSTFYLNIIFLF